MGTQELFFAIAGIAGGLSAIYAAWKIAIVPVKEAVKATTEIKTGVKCLLRLGMLSVYYTNREKKELHQYERVNFGDMYQAYKALNGNSFMDDINNEVREWEVIA